MQKDKFSYLPIGAAKYENIVHTHAAFILQKQLKDKINWKKFVNVFRSKEDILDYGWRGEYFGKMMRGACLTYRYCPDEELYEILYETVKDLLSTQDDLGRICTYTVEKEYNGWDVWSRKYVLVGCLYFHGICKDESFKTQILNALCRHVDYLIATIGDEESKKKITDTSEWWGAVNSCSILEPIVELYNRTKEERFLRFAEYILGVGGCRDGNLLELAEAGEVMPYQYPETKAYETTSFFEGALAYYETTGEKRYLEIVKKYMDAVYETDVTIIGCSGCTHELFDNSAVKQTEKQDDDAVLQETCVTVTWMRVAERLLRITGDVKYAEWIEKSALNTLYGSINVYNEKQYNRWDKIYEEGVPFDSYSPLVYKTRGFGIGGQKHFQEGGYYGCCACIGAAGTGLFPLIAVMQRENGFVFNYYNDGKITAQTPDGAAAVFSVDGNFLASGKAEITVNLEKNEKFALQLRVPAWSNAPTLTVNGEKLSVKQGYFTVEREWQNGDELILECNPAVEETLLNGMAAFTYGGLVLARDEKKEKADIEKPFAPIFRDGKPAVRAEKPQELELVRFYLSTDEGEVLLTDYASCGKKWTEENSRISVWLNIKK